MCLYVEYVTSLFRTNILRQLKLELKFLKVRTVRKVKEGEKPQAETPRILVCITSFTEAEDYIVTI
jgi:hypothetical protein